MKHIIALLLLLVVTVSAGDLRCGFDTRMKCGYTDSKGSDDPSNILVIGKDTVFNNPQVLVAIYYNPGTDTVATNPIYKRKFMLVSTQFYVNRPTEMDSLSHSLCKDFGSYLETGYCMVYHRNLPDTRDDILTFRYNAVDSLNRVIKCSEENGCETRYNR